jgi:hypothetical protein
VFPVFECRPAGLTLHWLSLLGYGFSAEGAISVTACGPGFE